VRQGQHQVAGQRPAYDLVDYRRHDAESQDRTSRCTGRLGPQAEQASTAVGVCRAVNFPATRSGLAKGLFDTRSVSKERRSLSIA
jgi:hypothetical protein